MASNHFEFMLPENVYVAVCVSEIEQDSGPRQYEFENGISWLYKKFVPIFRAVTGQSFNQLEATSARREGRSSKAELTDLTE
jgi:hypothetical protein